MKIILGLLESILNIFNKLNKDNIKPNIKTTEDLIEIMTDIKQKNYFSKKETSCRCGCGLDITAEMLAKLNQIRELYGKPISLNCGARCPTHNAAVKGAKNSAHISGFAVDMARNEELLKLILDNLETLNIWIEDPASTPSWIHCQIRPAKNRIFKP